MMSGFAIHTGLVIQLLWSSVSSADNKDDSRTLWVVNDEKHQEHSIDS